MREKRTRSLTGRRVLVALLAFFGVTVLANGALVVTALESWSGLIGPKPYEHGLAYNRTLEAARAQQALGWQVRPDFAPTGPRTGVISVAARDSSGTPLDGADVRAVVVRPTQAGHDFEVTFSPHGDGRYDAAVEFPLPGQWDVAILVEAGGHAFRTASRIRVE